MILLALAAAAAVPQPAPVKTFGDWTVACDNVRACTADSLMAEDGDFEGFLRMSLTRGPAAAAPVRLELGLDGPADVPTTLYVDGQPVQTLGPIADDQPVTLTSRAVAAMVAGKTVELRGGKRPVTASLAGFSAALRYWDDQQKRADTTTALVAKGAGTSVPAAPAVPVVKAVRAVGAAPRLTRAQGQAIRKRFNCVTVGATDETAEVSIDQLAPGRQVMLLPCGSGAYNFDSKVVIRTGAAIVEAPFDIKLAVAAEADGGAVLVNADFDPKTGILSAYAKARGLGDCGTAQQFVWDGTRFRLTQQLDMEECRGATSWMRTWTAKVVR